ncbi:MULTISPECIES: hypothetical protein [Entomomonas]|uniref:Uncharacterized protein n=1 Tax=Entomomonas asaccharolytica TaxID=2785331 RepID=A0A974NHE1_9GAMM|nr:MULTISPECIES: hypothetical protein [Entomomonas]QQP86880.1 hypothetical protein JHT90_06455 [Entomomonas asaccharolytica]UYZ83502.1 hypothetical protein MTZ49_13000 [Entomomonas sp. E2T0]
MAIFNSGQILVRYGGTSLASYLYEFVCKIERKCKAYRVPTMTDLLNEVVEHSRDEISLAHNINQYMMEQAVKVIYRSINRDCRDIIEQQLQVNKKFDATNPEFDNCEFVFLHHRVLGTNVELLIELQKYIEEYAKNLVSNGIQANVTFSLTVPQLVLDKLNKGAVSKYLDQVTNPNIENKTIPNTYLLRLGEMRRKKTREQGVYCYLKAADILWAHNDSYCDVPDENPDFIVLTVK